MTQDPRFYAQELPKAARFELDQAVERLAKRWFRPEVGSEIAVAMIMKACADRLSESEEGQNRLLRHLKAWSETVSSNESWLRAHRTRPPLPHEKMHEGLTHETPKLALEPETIANYAAQNNNKEQETLTTSRDQESNLQHNQPNIPKRYRPDRPYESPPPGTMREYWAARQSTRRGDSNGKTGSYSGKTPRNHNEKRIQDQKIADLLSTEPRPGKGARSASTKQSSQPTSAEIALLRQAAAIAGREALSALQQTSDENLEPKVKKPDQAKPSPIDPPWAQIEAGPEDSKAKDSGSEKTMLPHQTAHPYSGAVVESKTEEHNNRLVERRLADFLDRL